MDLNSVDPLYFNVVFGPGEAGASLTDRVRHSSRRFVRSQDHLAVYTPGATGHVLAAWEAIAAYGFDLLYEASIDGPTPLVVTLEEPARSIRRRREALGIEPAKLAAALQVPADRVVEAENPRVRSPIQLLERIAVALGLDERLLSFEEGAGGDRRLAARLRTLAGGTAAAPVYSPTTVIGFDEAAWVVATQSRLAEWLGLTDAVQARARFAPSRHYGDRSYPAWRHGFFLAQQARQLMGLSADQTVDSMRSLCESTLRLPVLQVDLAQRIAGATIANGDVRGIVVNTIGPNENVWIRRATVAHELGHLLYDPDEVLDSLRVDEVDVVERDARDDSWDPVERRANAFAVEFLAPQRHVLQEYRRHPTADGGIRAVCNRFGISYTMARYQIWNGIDRSVPLEQIVVDRGSTPVSPSDEWRGRESFTADYFPLNGTSPARRGSFAGLVAKAEQLNLLSPETAASYLQADKDEFSQNADMIRALFPDL